MAEGLERIKTHYEKENNEFRKMIYGERGFSVEGTCAIVLGRGATFGASGAGPSDRGIACGLEVKVSLAKWRFVSGGDSGHGLFAEDGTDGLFLCGVAEGWGNDVGRSDESNGAETFAGDAGGRPAGD